jgi:hypothetical protein
MTTLPPLPKPLFDTRELLTEEHPEVEKYIEKLAIPEALKEFKLCCEFLKSYANSNDTYTSYRREVERLLHWSWLIAKKKLASLHVMISEII